MIKLLKWLFSPDRFVFYIGGGGGGGSAPASQTQVSDLPEWAKPYAKETLGKTAALTDVQQNPYQTYGQERIAGFTPLQEQSFQGAAQLGPSQLGQQAGQMAGAATYGALGTQYDPYRMGQFTAGRAAQYMNPFVEMAMAPQLREAQRSSEMQKMADQAQAVRSGAFGGSRQAIVEAERQRNLGMQQGDIRAKGYMSAFDQAQQQFAREQQMREQSRQYGAGLGLQGLQTALQGAGQMGQLGQTEFGQRQAALGLQQQFGAQQQQQEQQRLSQDYQDFLTQQRYPYQQLEFMSNILRGTPMGTVQSMYAPGPTALQNLASLGMGAYGAKQLGMFAKGGSVTSDYFVESALDKLSEEQLKEAERVAVQRGDRKRLMQIAEEKATRASEGKGLAGMYNMLPQGVQAQMAGGGIVAFSRGGEPISDDSDDEYVQTPGGLYVLGSELEGESGDLAAPSLGSPEMHRAAASRALGAGQQIARFQPTVMTPEQERAYVQQQFNLEKELAGPDRAAAALREYFTQANTEREQNLREAKGMAALKAAGAVLQPGGLMRGLGAAGSAFAESYGKAAQADRAEKRALKMAEVNLLDAERKERMGQAKSATSSLAARRQNLQRADKLHLDKLRFQQEGAAAVARATRPTAQRQAAEAKLPEQLAAAEIAFANNPTPENRKVVAALRSAMSQAKTSDVGGRRGEIAEMMAGLSAAQLQQRIDADVRAAVSEAKISPAYVNAKTDAERKQVLKDAADAARELYAPVPTPSLGGRGRAGAGTGAGTAANPIRLQ